MKSLLIGLLALGSLSAFAGLDCKSLSSNDVLTVKSLKGNEFPASWIGVFVNGVPVNGVIRYAEVKENVLPQPFWGQGVKSYSSLKGSSSSGHQGENSLSNPRIDLVTSDSREYVGKISYTVGKRKNSRVITQEVECLLK